MGERRRIILATFGSHGDVHPFVGLARTLQARGHDVTLHTSNYFAKLAADAGVPFAGFGTVEEFEAGINNPDAWHPRRGVQVVFKELVARTVRRSYDVLKPMVTGDTVLVGHSLAFSARILHDELGCPGATVHLSPSVIRSNLQPPKITGLFMPLWFPMWLKRKIWETGDRVFIDPLIAPTVNELRKELGLAPVSRLLNEWWNHEELIIGLWPEFFGPRIPDWPGHLQLVGFPLYDETGLVPLSADVRAFMERHPKPVALTPGSAMVFGQKFFSAAVEACTSLSRPALLLSRHADHIPKDLPDSVKHVPYAPFSQLLPHCAAIVHHGGIGTTSQALRAGIPQLITPFSHDQPDNAHRLKRLGVGLSLPPGKINAPGLAGLLNQLLTDPHTRKAAENLSKLVTTDGLSKAADLIERLQPKALRLTAG